MKTFFTNTSLILKLIKLLYISAIRILKIGKAKNLNQVQQVKAISQELRHCSNRILESLYVDLTIDKAINFSIPDDRPILVLSNHQSSIDIPLILANLPYDVRFIAKSEVSWYPIIKQAMHISGTIVINMKHPMKLATQIKKIRETLKNGIKLAVFPEGTRSYDNTILSFELGIFKIARELEALILPIAIDGAYKVHRHASFTINTHQKVKLHIMSPIDTKNYGATDYKTLRNDIKQLIKDKMPS